MAGAGISTAAGIPDFRSPTTGLYANLARLNLPYPEAVFDISFFRKTPEPFYALAHELYPGSPPSFWPTLAHCFIRLLHDKGLLLKVFTQNIDCLERAVGIPNDSIVEAHGSFASQRCIECKTPFPDEEMRTHITAKEVPYCPVPECNGLVKPDIVFFGEGLPKTFFDNLRLPAEADLGIVMGTSLTVFPFAALPEIISLGTPRVLINMERVGDFGSHPDDIMLLGDIEAGVIKLAEAIGWRSELETLWKEMNPGKTLSKTLSEKEEEEEEEEVVVERSRDEAFQDDLEKLTKDVEESLAISAAHADGVRSQLLERDGQGGGLGHVFPHIPPEWKPRASSTSSPSASL